MLPRTRSSPQSSGPCRRMIEQPAILAAAVYRVPPKIVLWPREGRRERIGPAGGRADQGLAFHGLPHPGRHSGSVARPPAASGRLRNRPASGAERGPGPWAASAFRRARSSNAGRDANATELQNVIEAPIHVQRRIPNASPKPRRCSTGRAYRRSVTPIQKHAGNSSGAGRPVLITWLRPPIPRSS